VLLRGRLSIEPDQQLGGDAQEDNSVLSPREVQRNSKDVNGARFDVDMYICDLLKQGASYFNPSHSISKSF